MNNTKHTFSSIFNDVFEIEELDERTNELKKKNVALEKIVIPKIQRDYAQGRKKSREIERTRNNFLDALYKAVDGKSVSLDFIYGDIDSKGVMTPLDGQQRLTTLFLLYWYASKKEKVSTEKCSFLKRFSYDTRYSAREFCEKICSSDFVLDLSKTISAEIKDQAWFPMNWENDATISSMLVMLDEIKNKFSQTENLWEKLEKISFYFLPIKDIGLTDDLYIKMNSRGKPLTQFEHFKAELEKNLRGIDSKLLGKIDVNTIIQKIDGEWTDVLWDYCDKNNKDNLIDYKFLNYFRFICNVLCYKNDVSSSTKAFDEFDLIEKFFSPKVTDVADNIKFFEVCFDVWANVKREMPITNFFEKFISKEYEVGKVKFFDANIDVFKTCLINSSGLRQIVLLYAFVLYLLPSLPNASNLYDFLNLPQNYVKISENDFVRRLRVLNNLCQNSLQNEMREDRMPNILKQVDSVITTGEVNLKLGNNFNSFQLNEEIKKFEWLKNNSDKAEALFKLEDHKLLYGQISVVGLENYAMFSRFESLFSCKYELIDNALLAKGDYKKNDAGCRYCLGSNNDEVWKSLLHGVSSTESIKKVLNELLTTDCDFSDEKLKKIADDYILSCEKNKLFDWRYYYIKYNFFRGMSYGKYWWPNAKNEPYDFTSLRTEWNMSTNSYQVFLYSLTDKVDRDSLGQRILISGNRFLKANNKGFVVYDLETSKEIDHCMINQNEDGIDIEDRIAKGRKWFSSL